MSLNPSYTIESLRSMTPSALSDLIDKTNQTIQQQTTALARAEAQLQQSEQSLEAALESLRKEYNISDPSELESLIENEYKTLEELYSTMSSSKTLTAPSVATTNVA